MHLSLKSIGVDLIRCMAFVFALQAEVALAQQADVIDWDIASPQVARIDATKLAAFSNHVSANLGRIRGIVVIRDGKFAFEHYRPGVDQQSLHDTASVTKSILSSLVGLGMPGRFALDDTLGALLPETDIQNPAASTVSLRHLMGMASGFDRTGNNTSEDYLYFQPRLLNNSVLNDSLKRPMVRAQGQVFSYSAMDAHLVSVILSRKLGQNARDVARDKLFMPLGIARFDWLTPHQDSSGASDLSLTARDMAKLGQLWLQNGRWAGQQIIPAAYLDQARKPMSTLRPPPASGVLGELGYGLFFWIAKGNNAVPQSYFASGHGGQFIWVIPSLRVVIAVQSDVTDAEHRTGSVRVATAIRDFLIPAFLP
jgi:CubicO group peptidase (beta-lactamase class C family)